MYQSPRGTAIAATALLAATGAATVFSLVSEFRLYTVAGDLVADAKSVDLSTLTDADQLHQNASTIHLVTLLASAVTFIIWFYRVRVNAETFDPHGHRHKRGWAIGGWFVPVAALWFPRQIAADIWQAGARPDELGVRQPLPLTLLNLWWSTFLMSGLVSRIGARISTTAAYPDTYQQSMVWLAASDLLELAAAVFAILMVRKLTATQEQRFTEATSKAYGVPASTVQS
ncbi:DUF4328 domain-containing protein [Kitasatospora sp. NPDC056446]|uniref:DUF4328 domain-containing protein n=1 Tax=Kitasatospora sp. NPDC056446 TaxID=3345819 RepID=UPI00368F875B